MKFLDDDERKTSQLPMLLTFKPRKLLEGLEVFLLESEPLEATLTTAQKQKKGCSLESLLLSSVFGHLPVELDQVREVWLGHKLCQSHSGQDRSGQCNCLRSLNKCLLLGSVSKSGGFTGS